MSEVVVLSISLLLPSYQSIDLENPSTFKRAKKKDETGRLSFHLCFILFEDELLRNSGYP